MTSGLAGSVPNGNDARPWLLEARSSPTFITITVTLSLFTDMLLYGMLTPIMPDALVTRAEVPLEDREYWISFMLIAQSGTSFICAPIFGYLVDRTGKTKALYLIGLIMLMASMILFAGAKSLQLFIIARIPQGAAVAMVYVAGLTLLIESVPKDKLGYLFGCLDISLAFGIIAGPLFGGIVYSFAGYHAVFWAALMLLTIDLVLRLAVISRSSAAQWLKMPVSEHPSGVEAIEDVGYGSIFAEETDQSCHQPREELSILSLHREPRVVISVVAMLVFSLLLAAFDNMLPTFVEDHFQWDSFGAGMVFIPLGVAVFLGPFFGYLSDRFGARMNVFLGFGLAAPCLACLRFVKFNTTEHQAIFIILLFLVGVCLNAVNPAVMAEMQNAIFELEASTPGAFGKNGAIGRTCSLQHMAQTLGFTLGPILGGLIDHQYGWGATTIVLGVTTAVAAVPGLWLPGPSSEKVQSADALEEQEPLLKSSSAQSSSVIYNYTSSVNKERMVTVEDKPVEPPVGHRFETAATRPDLWHLTYTDPTHGLFVFEEWIQGDVSKRYYRQLGEIKELSCYQTMIVRNSDDRVIGAGVCTPFFWPELSGASQDLLDSGDLPQFASTLPDGGWETILGRGVVQARARQGERPSIKTTPLTEDQRADEVNWWLRDKPNAMSGLLVVIAESYRGQRLADLMLANFKQLARRNSLKALVIPLRPTDKPRYPHVSFEEYFSWVQGRPYHSGFTWPTSNSPDQPLPYDPWLRKHIRMGAKAVKPAVRSCTIVASAEEWERRLGDKIHLDSFVDQDGKRCVVGDKLDGFVLKDQEQSAPFQWDPVRQVGTYSETDMWIWHQI